MFGNKETLAAHFNDENFINDISEDKLTEMAAQISDMITSYTGIEAEAVVTNNPAILRNIWCNLVSFTMIPYQTDIAQEEKQRRETLYNKAFEQLDKIREGTIVVKSNGGRILNSAAQVCSVEGTKRIYTL